MLHITQCLFDLSYILPMLCKRHIPCFRDRMAFFNGLCPLISIQKLAQMMPHIWSQQQLLSLMQGVMPCSVTNEVLPTGHQRFCLCTSICMQICSSDTYTMTAISCPHKVGLRAFKDEAFGSSYSKSSKKIGGFTRRGVQQTFNIYGTMIQYRSYNIAALYYQDSGQQ